MSTEVTPKSPYNVKNPFIARLKHAHDLTGAGAVKHTRHFEIDLAGSGLEFIPGDSLAVLPTNDPDLVNELIAVLGFTGDELITNPKGVEVPVRLALLESYSITDIDNKLLKVVIEKTSGETAVAGLTDPERKDDLKRYLYGREVIDVLLENPSVRFVPSEFVAVLKKLIIRLYSISSSLKAVPEEVHLTVATVRYESHGRARKGVASTFLSERLTESTPVPVFVNPGKGFRLPAPEEDTPIIMCGPGTGIAPFRAFLQERKATAAKGKAWLFFGETNQSTCFFYREEFEAYLADGTLSRLDTAWSRDQAEKIYVQHKMLENGPQLWEWLEQGAIFYVCGDASRMAVDVDKALHQIAETYGGKTAEESAAYMEKLKADKRYRRDVY